MSKGIASATRTVVLADSQALSRQGVRLLLEREGFTVCGETENGCQAVQLADQLQPNLLITDLDLEMLPGLEVIRQVRRASPTTAILVLTQIETCASVIGAVRAGAQGYCLRTSDADEFHRALEAVTHGDMYVCPRVAKHLVPGRCSCDESQDCQGINCLTGRELQVIKLVAQGYSSPQIAGLLDLSPATVDRHRANVMQKLSLHSVPALVLFAARSGLVDLKRVPA